MYQRLTYKLGSGVRMLGRSVRHGLSKNESERAVAIQAQRLWTSASQQRENDRAHWRGRGLFANDDDRWFALGANSLRIFECMAGADWRAENSARVVDWGCAGGENAVHFAGGASQYYGIDASPENLSECRRQMELAGLHSFAPIRFEVGQPERLFDFVDDPCDLVVSCHFFAVVPTKRYAEHLLRIMARLLRTDGLAFIQIKYDDSTWSSRARAWSPEQGVREPTTYRIDDFWTMAARSGFKPEQVVLEPEQRLLHDRRYAYFLLRKLA